MLEQILCPKCNNPMTHLNLPSKRAFSYEDCIRRCEICKVGASNASKSPTFIYKNLFDNIPSPLHYKLLFTLDNALNERNRENKKTKISYSTSEDALSWIFFSYFLNIGKLSKLANILSIDEEICNVIFWGVPFFPESIGLDFREKLKKISTMLGEDERSLSEPDVIIITKNDVFFIEVKLKANNEVIPASDKFNKYLKSGYYTDIKNAKESGHYELIRNWTIGNMLNTTARFRLINLGPEVLFHNKNKSQLIQFKNALSNPSSFQLLTWESLLDKLNELDCEEWFVNDIRRRIRITTVST